MGDGAPRWGESGVELREHGGSAGLGERGDDLAQQLGGDLALAGLLLGAGPVLGPRAGQRQLPLDHAVGQLRVLRTEPGQL